MKKKGWKGTWFYYLVGTLILACICVVLAFVYKYQGMPNVSLNIDHFSNFQGEIL